ncbi:hypothetical protein [Naasia aerilata]|uniref:hypothetical protein n=1 Tax=Naasia aerilata TaxID=1162966 RepID=UPI0025739512|nr:hypothetical protein [Naasia aerilata]
MQLAAPVDRRGRFLGAYVMTSQGFRVGSGLLIGVLGAGLGASVSVGIGAALLIVLTAGLLLAIVVAARRRTPIEPPADAEAGVDQAAPAPKDTTVESHLEGGVPS